MHAGMYVEWKIHTNCRRRQLTSIPEHNDDDSAFYRITQTGAA